MVPVEVALPEINLHRSLYLIHHRQKHISKALARFLSYCRVAFTRRQQRLLP